MTLLKEAMRLALMLIAVEAIVVLLTGNYINGDASGFWGGLL